MHTTDFNYITEFSGLGGSALGLQQAGGRGLLAIEYDPYDKSQNAYQHLVANFSDMAREGRILNRDITTVSGEDIKAIVGDDPVHILQSSAPCQGFSLSNSKRNASDSRNELFMASIEHVRMLQPMVTLFENVAGMTNGAMKGTFLRIVSSLKAAGYRVGAWVLNASDYGAPQTRPRTWIIGIREDLNINPSVPQFAAHPVSVKDVLQNLTGFRQGQFDRATHPSTLPCCTITKTPGFQLIDAKGQRSPTVEELRILSTFPANFKFVGTKTQIHNRLGNSVLPLQARVLAEHLYQTVIKPAELAAAIARQSRTETYGLDDFSVGLLQEALAS